MSKLLNNILEDSILWFSFGREKSDKLPLLVYDVFAKFQVGCCWFHPFDEAVVNQL